MRLGPLKLPHVKVPWRMPTRLIHVGVPFTKKVIIFTPVLFALTVTVFF